MKTYATTYFYRLSIRWIATTLMLLFATAFGATGSSAADTALPAAKDLAAEALVSEQQLMPLIVMVSLPGCPYCEVVRRSHLLPLLNEAARTPRPVIRQVELNGSATLRDFDGTEITHQAFARQYKVKIAPVVFFFNARGEQLAEPLVGAMIPDFYGAYFDAALKEASKKIAAATSKAAATGKPNATP